MKWFSEDKRERGSRYYRSFTLLNYTTLPLPPLRIKIFNMPVDDDNDDDNDDNNDNDDEIAVPRYELHIKSTAARNLTFLS